MEIEITCVIGSEGRRHPCWSTIQEVMNLHPLDIRPSFRAAIWGLVVRLDNMVISASHEFIKLAMKVGRSTPVPATGDENN